MVRAALLLALAGCGGPVFTAAGLDTLERDGATDAADLEGGPGTGDGGGGQDALVGGDGGQVEACAPVTHSDGVGQTWQDCALAGTYTHASAMQACVAYALSIGDTAVNCFGPWTFCGVAEGTSMVCHGSSDEAGTAGLTCETYCWAYSGSHVGLVTQCSCGGVGAWR
jgi:hypothetical protein